MSLESDDVHLLKHYLADVQNFRYLPEDIIIIPPSLGIFLSVSCPVVRFPPLYRRLVAGESRHLQLAPDRLMGMKRRGGSRTAPLAYYL
jgi:hypothetical protein